MADNGNSPFDFLAEEYDGWYENEGKLVFEIEVAAFRELTPLLPKPWLEVGVGSGRFAQALGIETGIDPSANLLQIARNRNIKTYQAKGEEHLFDKETFGTVFFIVTLWFIDSPPRVLQEARCILKPEGKIAIGMVLRESPWGRFYEQKKNEGHRFYKHATFHSYQDIKKLLTDSGFDVSRVVSTLFQKPGEVKQIEALREGYHDAAGFTLIIAGKSASYRGG
jgi:SAM-dependent methyltransferase